jgi:Domain of unknown function (DUF4189)
MSFLASLERYFNMCNLSVRSVLVAALTLALSFPAFSQNSCNASAYSAKGNVGGTAWASDKKIAEQQALAKCHQFNGGAGSEVGKTCKIKESNCKK